MNPSNVDSFERLDPVERLQAYEDIPQARHVEASRGNPLWAFEDIEEPESWELASFDDLVPHDLA